MLTLRWHGIEHVLWRRWIRRSGNNATRLCLPETPLPYLQLLDTSAQFFELRLEEEYSRGRETMRRMDLTETLEPKVCSLSGLGVDLVPLIHRYKNPMKMK